jgi:putative membrane protein
VTVLGFVRIPYDVTNAVIVAVALLSWFPYRRRARRLAAEGRPVPAWRQRCYAAGVIVLLGAFSSPVDDISDRLLVAHMTEHLFIGDIATLLIVLGLTGPLIAPLLRQRGLGWARVFAHPLVALPVWAIDLYAWHVPVLYEAALRNDYVHIAEHGCFLFAGLAMWMALLGPLPKPSWYGNLGRLGYIIAVRLIEGILGNIFLWSNGIFYPYYRAFEPAYHLSALQDQIDAGAVMMVEGSFVTLGLFCWLFMRAAAHSEQRQALMDYARSHDLELDEARAARAVAAGRGDELRHRLEAAVPPRTASGGPAGAPRQR